MLLQNSISSCQPLAGKRGRVREYLKAAWPLPPSLFPPSLSFCFQNGGQVKGRWFELQKVRGCRLLQTTICYMHTYIHEKLLLAPPVLYLFPFFLALDYLSSLQNPLCLFLLSLNPSFLSKPSHKNFHLPLKSEHQAVVVNKTTEFWSVAKLFI